MGNSQSTVSTATQCKFNKTVFKDTNKIIDDAHDVMQFYASVLLAPRTPSKIGEYKNYSSLTEAVFNSQRESPNSEIQALGAGLNTYYDVYLYVKDFKNKYERISDEVERREKLGEIFNLTNGVLKIITQELANACQ